MSLYPNSESFPGTAKKHNEDQALRQAVIEIDCRCRLGGQGVESLFDLYLNKNKEERKALVFLSFPKTESITALKSCIAREIMNIKLK